MGKSKIDYQKLAIEAVMIVFTVLLALALNEWRSSLKESKMKDDALSNILLEIKSNKEDLEYKMEYHHKMSEKIGQYLASDSLWGTLDYETAIEAMTQIMEKGIQNPSLQSGAWRSAELSGIVNTFDYETLYVLSNTYRVQESGPENTWKQLAALFADPESYEKDKARRLGFMLQLGFGELHSQERSLIHNYEAALEVLEK